MKTSRRLDSAYAFTLLELLVVITIIAVLAGILLPVSQGVLDKAKKTDAKSTESSIVTAVKAYQTEYGQYPVEAPTADSSGSAAGTAQDVTFDVGSASQIASGKGGHNGILFDVLRALNNNTGSTGDPAYKALNARKIVYFESKDVKNPADPHGGFIPSGASNIKKGLVVGDLTDPWGNPFCVRVDTNYTDALALPYPIQGNFTNGITYTNTSDDDSTKPDQILRTAVAVMSAGKDGVFGNAQGALDSTADDVVSWQ